MHVFYVQSSLQQLKSSPLAATVLLRLSLGLQCLTFALASFLPSLAQAFGAEIEHAGVAKSQRSLAMELAFFPASFESGPVDESNFTLATLLVHVPLAGVLVAKAVHLGAEAMSQDLA